MASIIPNQSSPSIVQDISMPQEGNIDCVGSDLVQVKSVDTSCVESLIQAVDEEVTVKQTNSTVGPRSTLDIPSAVNIQESEFETQDLSQPVDDSANEVTEASSPTASSPSSSSQLSSGQHHSHHSSSYASYYPSYHSSYYYPPGAYYPPPPSHGGHQSYSHYYAHYGAYYPPPPYHYYAQPSNSTAPELSSGINNSTSSSYLKKDSNPVSRTATNSKSATKGPYSALSTFKKKPTTSSKSLTTTTPQTTKPTSSKIQSTSNSTSKKRKQESEPSDDIFRMNANKKCKQVAAESKAVAAAIAAKQAKTKEMEKQQLSQTILGRRERKNAQSRMRASKLKQRIKYIQETDPNDRTEEEVITLQLFEERRQRKNGRSRDRAVERKQEYERIMAIPESDWTKEEKQFVQETIVAKFKKNEGDRLRRKKLKEELDSTASTISSDWESLKHMKSKQGSRRKTSTNAIPSYVDSSDNYHVDNSFQCQDLGQPFHHTKDVPLTPVTQKEVYSLLESTPTNVFGSTVDPKADFQNLFSLNFGLNTPTKGRDFSANMDSIDFDSLELPTDGVSILDPSMALGDEVIYSPNLQRHNLNEQFHHHPAGGDYSVPQFNSAGLGSLFVKHGLGLSPLNSPRRNRSSTIDGHYFTSSEYDIPDVQGREAKNSGDGSKAIAVSFSDDTA